MFGFFTAKDKKPPAKMTGEALRTQALANARAARAELGEETIQKIVAAMAKKGQSAAAQAQAKIQSTDVDRVLDELMFNMRDKP